jgi:anti-anti-sigma regulatory factor
MFKIQKSVDREFVVLSLSGRIDGGQLEELKRIFASEADGHRVVLNLEAVKLVDCDVVAFLAQCENDGIRLVNCPAYIREWITRRQEAANEQNSSDDPMWN